MVCKKTDTELFRVTFISPLLSFNSYLQLIPGKLQPPNFPFFQEPKWPLALPGAVNYQASH